MYYFYPFGKPPEGAIPLESVSSGGELASSAIDACSTAAKLSPADAATRYRMGMMLRRVPGRLQEAIQHFNGCLHANGTYPGAREASEEAVMRLREMKKPKTGWQHVLGNLIPVLLFMGAAFHFTSP